MNVAHPKKVVLLGMMTRIPVAGAVWGTMHYLVGLRRLGYEPYYVESHARTPTMLMERDDDDSSALAAAFIDNVMRRFDLGRNWCFHALHDDGRCYGLSKSELKQLYRDAALIINYHGSTVPLPEHYATNRLVYLETDPVDTEIELHEGRQDTKDFLQPHVAFFTWGLNYGHADCRVPLPERTDPKFKFKPLPPAVVTDLWDSPELTAGVNGTCRRFTTIGNWRQNMRPVTFEGEVYTWSKHYEFLKFIDLPQCTSQPFELGLSSYEPADKTMLESKGWHVSHAMDFSKDLAPYRDFIRHSRGEFTVAKDQNVRLRSGWFSERSAQYLAARRPVITQDTGFGSLLPTGSGLFAFRTMDDILAAVETVNRDYEGQCRAAAAVARECLNYDVVIKSMLSDCSVDGPTPQGKGQPMTAATTASIATATDVSPKGYWLDNSDDDHCFDEDLANTLREFFRSGSVLDLGCGPGRYVSHFRAAGIEADGYDGNPHTPQLSGGLCSVMDLSAPVDLGRRYDWVMSLEVGEHIPQQYEANFLDNIVKHARLGVVLSWGVPGQGGKAEVNQRDNAYIKHRMAERGFVNDLAAEQSLREAAELAWFKETLMVFRRHPSAASAMAQTQTETGGVPTTEATRLPHHPGDDVRREVDQLRKTVDELYWLVLMQRTRDAIITVARPGSQVVIVGGCDDDLMALPGRQTMPFPQTPDGVYSGSYIARGQEVVSQLDALRAKGAAYVVFPATSFWWIEHYPKLASYLENACRACFRSQACAIYAFGS